MIERKTDDQIIQRIPGKAVIAFDEEVDLTEHLKGYDKIVTVLKIILDVFKGFSIVVF